MAATGLFLCLFLLGHLAGNLQLFKGGEEGQLQFNAYAKFMTSNPIVKILSYVTYASILFHAIDGILLTRSNMKARPQNYAYSRPSANSHWTSRNMGILGTIILVFIVVHMSNFWYEMHWGTIGVDSAGNKDLHTVVMAAFTDPGIGLIYTIGYVLAMFAVGFHLIHGFQSAFQSLGLKTRKIEKAIHMVGYGFAILVPLLFASIPVFIYLTK
jgi:succinate dehydrogenase / fumarate reductase cytochrome b subunit